MFSISSTIVVYVSANQDLQVFQYMFLGFSLRLQATLGMYEIRNLGFIVIVRNDNI